MHTSVGCGRGIKLNNDKANNSDTSGNARSLCHNAARCPAKWVGVFVCVWEVGVAAIVDDIVVAGGCSRRLNGRQSSGWPAG